MTLEYDGKWTKMDLSPHFTALIDFQIAIQGTR